MANIRDQHSAGPVEILVAVNVRDHTALGVIPNDRRLEANGIRLELMPAIKQHLAFGSRQRRVHMHNFHAGKY